MDVTEIECGDGGTGSERGLSVECCERGNIKLRNFLIR
jgi:hypothetical protein